jgi:NAD+ synthase
MTEENKAQPQKDGDAERPAPRKNYRRYRSSRWHKKPASKEGEKVDAAKPNAEIPAPEGNAGVEKANSTSASKPPVSQAKPVEESQAAKPSSAATPTSQPRGTQKRSGRYSSYNRRPRTEKPATTQSSAVSEANSAKLEFGFTTELITSEETLTKQFAGSLSTGMKGLKFPGIDPQHMKKHLIQSSKELLEAKGKTKVVVGISGGLDSAVVAGLMVEALGRDHVHLVHFIEVDHNAPIRTRADAVAHALRCPLEMIDLRSVLKGIFATKSNVLPLARKRRIARERMAALYDIADAKEAVVLGCLNKTKFILGYGIEHGDLAYVLNPLGDLYQSQVLEMARYLKVPRILLDNALRVYGLDGKRWEQNVERLWKELDYYLYQIIDVRISLAHLQKLGMQEEKLFWIYQRVRDSAHQRIHPPVVPAALGYIPRAGEL